MQREWDILQKKKETSLCVLDRESRELSKKFVGIFTEM